MDLPAVLSRRRLALFVRLVVNAFAQAAATVTTALLVDYTFDAFLSGSGPSTHGGFLWVAIGLPGAALFAAVLRFYERTDAERVGQDYAFEVRVTLYERLVSLSPRAMTGRSKGGTMLRFVGDLNALRQFVSLGLARLIVGSISAVGALGALVYINWALAVAVGGVLTAGTIGAISRASRLRSATQEARKRRGRMAANVNEKVASIAVVQVFNQRNHEQRRLAREGRRLRDAMVRRAKVTGQLRAITEGTVMAGTAAALLVGVHEVSAGRARPGTVAAAMAIVGLLHSPLRDLGRVHEYWQNAQVAMRKIREFLDIPSLVTEMEGAPDLVPGPGRLDFEGVSLAGALVGVTASARPGSRVAIVGPNGAGKSTLLAVAARLIDPDSGTVRLDRQDLQACSLASVRRAVGMVSPDLPLLRGTIEENLRYRWPRAPSAEVDRVAELCGIDEILADFPDGNQTRVAEAGANLSVGQRQRIALARALLGEPPVLLLDEVDANLDARAAQVIGRILGGYKGTVLLVTHRADRLRAADVIWHLEGGRLVEQGTPERVELADGPTRRLLGIQ
jgi:ABC-type multidrug transport system fused ATPase/permease subunit